jgi:hypothetical protein
MCIISEISKVDLGIINSWRPKGNCKAFAFREAKDEKKPVAFVYCECGCLHPVNDNFLVVWSEVFTPGDDY